MTVQPGTKFAPSILEGNKKVVTCEDLVMLVCAFLSHLTPHDIGYLHPSPNEASWKQTSARNSAWLPHLASVVKEEKGGAQVEQSTHRKSQVASFRIDVDPTRCHGVNTAVFIPYGHDP